MTSKRGPDFLGIGPEKTGTTWMFHALGAHPEVDMPREKEIRYLWARHFLGTDNLPKKLFHSNWHYAQKRRRVFNSITSDLRALRHGKFRWRRSFNELRYFLHKRTDDWYLSQFSSEKLSGDISPTYHQLPPDAVSQLREMLPHTKVIASFRDPVERDWSHLKMELCQRTGRSIEDVPREEYEQRMQRFRFRYTRIIEKWGSVFGDHLLVVFYDELREDPVGLYRRLCAFLGISDPSDAFIKGVLSPRNEGISGGVPDWLGPALWQRRRPMVEALADAMPDSPWPARWLSDNDARFGTAD